MMSYRKLTDTCLFSFFVINFSRVRFYKETLSGETSNFINITAAYEGTDSITTLNRTAKEAIDCARRIESVLAGKGEYERAWRLHAAGYIQMHIMRGRYRLWELGVGDKPDKKEVIR